MTKKRITVAVEEALVKDLRHLAIEKGARFSELVDQALTQFIKKNCPK